MWSRKFAECQKCHSAQHPHGGAGLCVPCYKQAWAARHRATVKAKQAAWYQQSKNTVDYRQRSTINRYGLAAWDRLQQEPCEKCGTRDELQIHHKDHNGLNVPKARRNNNPENLQVLCIRCHAAEHITKKCDGWSLRYACCQLCHGTARRHQARGYCTRCYSAKDRKPRPWAKNCGYAACVKCGTTAVPHKGRGHCRRCFEHGRVRVKV